MNEPQMTQMTQMENGTALPNPDRPEPIDPTIERNFTYHLPKDGQPAKYEAIRFWAKSFAYVIKDATPPGREQSLALTNLEQAVMWANAGIARGS